jgi:precorrin-2/cobalt-factor-2 C20-methyltransferase
MRMADVIYVPESDTGGRSVAERIILPYADSAKIHPSYFPMLDDHEELNRRYTVLAEEIKSRLDDGQTVAYAALGDTMLYSTALYVAERLRALGVRPEFIAGVSSYVASANLTGIPLGEHRDSFVVQGMPDTAEELAQLAAKFRTVVIMKVSERLPVLLEYVRNYKPALATLVKRATLEGEIVFDLTSVENIDPEAGYLSVAIIKTVVSDHYEV